MTAESTDPEVDVPKKKSAMLPLLLGLVLALVLGGGGFYAVWSGMILGPAGDAAPDVAAEKGNEAGQPDAAPDIVFLPIEPVVVSLGPSAGSRYLRFRGELEVDPRYEAEVARVMPRILDTLNGFLRAVSVAELEDSGALLLLRAQMLRRIQIIVGDGAVRDLLIVEFVLS